MIKKIYTAILILFQFILLQESQAQTTLNVPDYLRQRFVKYCESVPREEIFVHSDREEFIAGEYLWFSVYLIDRQSFNPSPHSRIAYFELLNTDNRPVLQKRIILDKGFGPGQIKLPDSLSSGTYTIRAYTSWMKNFLPVNCFMKDIKIYNAFSKKAFREKVYADNQFIKGTENSFSPDNKINLLNVEVNNYKPDTLEIIINTDNRFRTENKNIVYLFIQTHGLIDHLSTEKILSDYTKVSIPKEELNNGINHVTVFDSGGNPISESYIYSPDKENQIHKLSAADSCNKRDKITLEIETMVGPDTRFNETNLSVSVAPITPGAEMMDINDYMVFGTEYGLLYQSDLMRGKVSELKTEAVDSILLNLRSNWINWSTILSGNIPDYKYPMESEDHFLSGRLLTGDKNKPGSGEILLLFTPGKEPGFQYSETDNEGNFRFNIHIDEDLKDLIIMPYNADMDHKIIIGSSFSDKYPQSHLLVDSTSNRVPPYISMWSVNYQVMTVYGASVTLSGIKPPIPPLKPLRFYGKPDIELIIADYISLPVMEEVFFELLPHVSLKKRKSNYEISISDRVDNSPYFTSPCLMIDGVIINDPAIIADLDPELVEKIDVIKEKYLVGNFVFSGIVNVITKRGDFSCITLPDYMIRQSYRVADRPLSFTSPDYSSLEIMNNHIPDFRNTLYWNPSVKPDKNGKSKIEFWTSDIVSNYEIIIQGTGQEGRLISLRKYISVKNK